MSAERCARVLKVLRSAPNAVTSYVELLGYRKCGGRMVNGQCERKCTHNNLAWWE